MEILMRFLKLRILLLAFAGMLAFFPAWAQTGDQIQLYEQKIKAGLVYNFLKYTTWPAETLGSNNSRLRVCLFGRNSLDGYLAPLQGKTAQQSTIVIDQISEVSEAENCHVVFINSNEEGRLSQLLNRLQGKHILTVSDIKSFTHQGGMVELVKEGEKINLYINTHAVNKAGLDIQGRMLKLAKLVSG